MMLDTYTIDLPEFIEKYEASNDNIKVALNIEKLKEAIKMGDYKYVYNRLDESFKLNNFKTLEEFEKFVKNEEFNAKDDKIEYKQYEKINGVHTYNITIKDKEVRVIMKLEEERDFIFSFSK